MNRIYQGRVSSVEIPKPAAKTNGSPTALFQDTTNY